MLAKRSCHWGPIIALSLVTIVTVSSTYCLFQLAVSPKVVLPEFKTFTTWSGCYTWVFLILMNFSRFVHVLCAFVCVQLTDVVLGTPLDV